MSKNFDASIRSVVFVSAALGLTILQAQPPNQTPAPGRGRGMGRGGPAVVSPHIESDGRVTFRVYAPQASAVTVNGDIAGGLIPAAEGSAATPAVAMAKGADGIWTGTTVRAIKPGAWRYMFGVDGATTVDARNTLTSPSQTQVQSLLVVPGDFSETRDVPHGAVSQVRYVASALNNARREMYVYTPPGYEKGAGTYPVLYLIHGGGDTAVSWSTVSRANDILDNLIAEKKVKPMIIVMPSGGRRRAGR